MSAACARSSSTGSSPGITAAAISCGSRTPIRAARSPRRSTRSRSRSTGSESTGTARSRSSSTGWMTAAASPSELVAAGKAYEDEGAIRFRMPDDGVTAWDDVVRGRDRVSERQARGRRHRPLRRPSDLQLRLAAGGRVGRDHARHSRRRPHLEHAEAAEHHPRGRMQAAPVYAHVPSIFGQDGKKLSKRHGATGIDEFRAAGYLPEALMNFLALLGWAPDGETTIMRRDELIERFTLERVSPSPAQFDYAKLDWMNGVYLRELSPQEYAHRLLIWLGENGYDWDAELVTHAAPLVQEKIARLAEFPDFAGFLFGDVEPDPADLDGRRADARGGRRGVRRRSSRSRRRRSRRRCASGRRRARPEAAAGVPAGPRRGHRLEGLPGPVREHRAARARDDAQPPAGGGLRRRDSRLSPATAAAARADRARAGRRATTGAGTGWSGGAGRRDRRSGRPRPPRSGCGEVLCHFKVRNDGFRSADTEQPADRR